MNCVFASTEEVPEKEPQYEVGLELLELELVKQKFQQYWSG